VRPQIWWHSRKKAVLVLAAALAVVAGMIGVLWASNLFGWRAWRLQEVEAFIGAALPGDARDIHFATQNQKTRIVWLRFTLSANESLAPFLTQMGVPDGLHSGFTPFPAVNPIESPLAWWTPQAAATYAGLYDDTGRKVIEILLDSDKQTVYVRTYSISS
jgi:hypothetical protein